MRSRSRYSGDARSGHAGVGFDLGFGAVGAFVIGEGVRVGADDVAVDERGPSPIAAVLHGFDHGLVAGDGVGAVDLGEVEVGEVGDQPGDVAAGGVGFNRGRDGVLLSSTTKTTGSLPFEAVLRASQNSPCEVEPSPIET